MKKLIFIAIFILGFSVFFPQYAFGQNMMDAENTANETAGEDRIYTESVETVLQEFLTKQKVDTIQKLDVSKISDDEWEKLGDSAMELQHPGQVHEIMDQMMGGEGSQSLRQVHINMGKAYLGFGGNYGYGMMGGGMMGGGGKSMMGNFGSNSMSTFGWGFGWLFMILFWGLIILGIVTLIKWIADQNKTHIQEKSALDILKERYVKGEIDKKEFEEKKKDVK